MRACLVCVCVCFGIQIDFSPPSSQGPGVESVQPHHSYILPAGREDAEGEAREGATQPDTITQPEQGPVQVHTHTHTNKHLLRRTGCCLCSVAYCQFPVDKFDSRWTDGAFFLQRMKDGLRIDATVPGIYHQKYLETKQKAASLFLA